MWHKSTKLCPGASLPLRIRRGAGAVFGLRCCWSSAETPNADVRKFQLQGGEPIPAPFVEDSEGVRKHLMQVPGVQDVFVAGSGSFVSVTRANGESWESLVPVVQSMLVEVTNRENLVSGSGFEEGTSAVSSSAVPLSEIEEDIIEVLDARIRPSVQEDGGDVELVGWDVNTGEVTLRLKGACRGCHHSAVTLQEMVLTTLRHYVPEVCSVTPAPDEDEDNDDPCADIKYAHDGQFEASTIQTLASGGTPFFSTFAGTKVEGKILKRVKFLSRLQLDGRTPEHVFVHCPGCSARRTIEDPQDLFKEEKGNTTGDAAVVICPTCAVLITP